MGSKIVALGLAFMVAVAWADTLNNPTGTKQVFDGVSNLTRTAGNSLLGKSQ